MVSIIALDSLVAGATERPRRIPWLSYPSVTPACHNRHHIVQIGDVATHATIWAALVAYAIGEAGRVAAGRRAKRSLGRGFWTAGSGLYVLHVVAAFHVHHGWSHTAAYAHTAEQTAALVGLDWGGGIYVNYAFTALWMGEAAWWWLAPVGYLTRARHLELTVRAVFLFMIVNGAVVFVAGPMRWVGLGICAAVWWIWWRAGYATDEEGRSAEVAPDANRE